MKRSLPELLLGTISSEEILDKGEDIENRTLQSIHRRILPLHFLPRSRLRGMALLVPRNLLDYVVQFAQNLIFPEPDQDLGVQFNIMLLVATGGGVFVKGEGSQQEIT